MTRTRITSGDNEHYTQKPKTEPDGNDLVEAELVLGAVVLAVLCMAAIIVAAVWRAVAS